MSQEVCIVCLDTENKLYPLSECNLEEAYEKLTGLSVLNDVKLAPTLCGECAHRLINCNRFREKSLRAHSLLLELAKNHESLTVQNIKSVNRETNQLSSNLIKKVFEPDYCDHYFVKSEENEKKTELEHKVKVKHEKPEYIEIVLEPKKENINCVKDKECLKLDEEEDIDIDYNDDIDNNIDFFDVITKKEKVQNDHYVVSNVPDVQFIDADDDHFQPFDDSKNKVSVVSIRNICPDRVNKTTVRVRKTPVRVKKTPVKVKKTAVKVNKKNVQKKPRKKPVKTKLKKTTKPINENKLSLFKISHLNYEEQVAEMKEREESASYVRSIYKCTICFTGFINENSHRRHMIKHTSKHGDFICDLCRAHFINRLKLIKHLSACHNTTYSCTSCVFITKHKKVAFMHEGRHKGDKYKCPQCDEEFQTVSGRFSHLRIKHPSDFICIFCGYSFISERGIYFHKRLVHRFENADNPQGPECAECNVRFVTEAAYNQHLKVSLRHNIEGRKYSNVPPCGYQRRSGQNITCELCGIHLKDYRKYRWHFKEAHPDKNQTQHAFPTGQGCLCELCGKVFLTQQQLEYHKAVHAGKRLLQCDKCPKGFNHKLLLNLHKKIHDENREMYACSVCDKQFTMKSNRDRHMWIHKGKSFPCETCDKTFLSNQARRTHFKHVHLKKPWPKRNRGPRGQNNEDQ